MSRRWLGADKFFKTLTPSPSSMAWFIIIIFRGLQNMVFGYFTATYEVSDLPRVDVYDENLLVSHVMFKANGRGPKS